MLAEVNLENIFVVAASKTLARDAQFDDLLDLERRSLLPNLQRILDDTGRVLEHGDPETIEAMLRNQSILTAEIEFRRKEEPKYKYALNFNHPDYTVFAIETDALHLVVQQMFPKTPVFEDGRLIGEAHRIRPVLLGTIARLLEDEPGCVITAVRPSAESMSLERAQAHYLRSTLQ